MVIDRIILTELGLRKIVEMVGVMESSGYGEIWDMVRHGAHGYRYS